MTETTSGDDTPEATPTPQTTETSSRVDTPEATPTPTQVTTGQLTKSADERKAILDRTLADRGAQGWRIETRSDYQATIATGNRINHVLHLILTI